MRQGRIPDDKFDCYESREVCRLLVDYLAALREHLEARRALPSSGDSVEFEGRRILAEIVFHETAAKVLRLQGAWIHAVDAFESAMKAEEPQP